VRRGEGALYLGTARVLRRGQLALTEPLDEPTWRDLVARANAPPPPAPEEAVAALTSSSTTAARIAAMRVFAERWYGCDASAPPLACEAPEALRVLHGLAKGHAVCAQNKLVSADELRAEDGKLVFYVENQGVCSWATEPVGDDPAVYVRASEWNAPWKHESDALSAFLVQMLFHEATFGAPFGASHDGLDARGLARLKKRVAPLPLRPWAASKTQFLGSGGVIGFVYPDADVFSVWLGAKERVRFEPLEDLVRDWTDVGF
jgi:hypothetical protein